MRMRNNLPFVVILGFLTVFVNAQKVRAQDEKKFEVGGHFSILQDSIPREATLTGIQCFTLPCPSTVISRSREIQPGFGGRFGFNFNRNIAVEAEVNFFPGADSFNAPFKGGHKTEGLFGVKAGKHFDKVGIFGKARPGFLHASKGDLRPRTDVLCIASVNIFPPPAGCFETISKTSFAFDVGGVVELYPTKRTIIRFDAGDTLVRLGERRVPLVLKPGPLSLAPTFLTVVRVARETTHNFQGSVGIGFRF